ncbi:MAG: hypothetical protein R6T83_00760 [Salinibacter sp.]
MLRYARPRPVLFLLALVLLVPPAAAQSVQSVVDEIRTRHEDQLEAVDNYVIETDAYTSYYRKVTRDGEPTYETSTQMNTDVAALNAIGTTPATTTALPDDLDRIAEHATYEGSESVDGRESHVLHIDDPGAVYEEMDNEVESMVYYVDADTYVPTRMMVTMRPQDTEGPSPTAITFSFRDYRTQKGLTVPYVTEMVMDLDISEEQQRQLEQMKEKMDQMPEQQREQMKRMMGDQFEKMEAMMAGEPTTAEVQSVRVNEGIPEGIFEDDDQ